MNSAKRFIQTYLSMSVDAYIHVYKKITVTIICSIEKKHARRIGQDFRIVSGNFSWPRDLDDNREQFAREKEKMRRSFPSRNAKRCIREGKYSWTGRGRETEETVKPALWNRDDSCLGEVDEDHP